jgi:putative ABC transport system substrate-binding protein
MVGGVRLPAIYSFGADVASGGLMCYGPDTADLFRRAASYVNRILKNEKPGDLPVQAPVKFELVINLKTAKALGLEVPPMLIARAGRGDRMRPLEARTEEPATRALPSAAARHS